MATTEKMTIHKALAELKVLDKRITSSISVQFCVANKHSNEKISGLALKDWKDIAQSSYQKANDLIRRNEAIKRAITLSNATTKVKVGDEEYTVAEAIWMKNHGMDSYKMLLRELQNQYGKAKIQCERENGETLEKRADEYIFGLFGSKEKAAGEEIENLRKTFIESQQYEIVDPIKIAEEIQYLEEKISSFESEVDAALSVSNATTEIEIIY